MKRQDFLAIAAAMIAAQRLAKVEGRLTMPVVRKFRDGNNVEEYDVETATKEVFEICVDAGEAATSVAQGLWNAWGNMNHHSEGLKKSEDEPFFDDDNDCIENPLDGIVKELHDLNNIMCQGEESVCGSLLRMAKSMPDTSELGDICTELPTISDIREQEIKRWTYIAEAVCRAQTEICEEWTQRLTAVGKKPKEDVVAETQEYYAAIATQVVSHVTDEDLAAMQ
jgi:hypothetical protein